MVTDHEMYGMVPVKTDLEVDIVMLTINSVGNYTVAMLILQLLQ